MEILNGWELINLERRGEQEEEDEEEEEEEEGEEGEGIVYSPEWTIILCLGAGN